MHVEGLEMSRYATSHFLIWQMLTEPSSYRRTSFMSDGVGDGRETEMDRATLYARCRLGQKGGGDVFR